mgnify:FL=1|tara:strand:- start:2443 stop:3411 length:969 start_codon:yes stop_codon:yes gene_type:complete
MFFKDKGVVLISILLIVLILSSVAVLFGNKYLLSLKRAQYLDFQSLSLNSFRNIESLSKKMIENEYKFNSNKLSKNNPIINNQIFFNVNEAQIVGKIIDASNCFNINSIVYLNDGNYLENTKTVESFRKLMMLYNVDNNIIEEMIDQIIDWIDKDSNPRTYGLEDYYYSGPLHSPREYSGMRLFVSVDELKSIPAVKDVDWNIIKNNFCALPQKSDFSININTLLKDNSYLLASFFLNIDLNDAEYIIDNIPVEGFENNDNLIKAFPDLDLNSSYGRIKFNSNVFELHTTITHNNFRASSRSTIMYGTNKNGYIISRIYNGI